jgi:hypothetical protein
MAVPSDPSQEAMHMLADKTRKDCIGGALMLLIGIGVMMQGARYSVGSLTNMGPGFFPVSLGAILALCGMAILAMAMGSAKGAAPQSRTEPRMAPEWIAWGCILLGIAAFVLIGRYGGLVPATFAVVFISALGDRKNTWKSALVLALSMVILAVGVFWWALQLQFSLFSWG